MIPAVAERVVAEFTARFHSAPMIARAPGRVNLIGDHTDYSEGFVLPIAIDRAAWIAFRPRSDRRVILHSLDFGDTAEFSLDAGAPHLPGWGDYVRGVAWALVTSGKTVGGWEGVVAGDVPVGAGLSSSAALELAAMRALTGAANDGAWNPVAMAKEAQRAENEWVGVNCGIMDQLISATGRAGYAMLIDCRSLETTPIPIPSSAAVVVLDTATRRELVTSAYNERRQQCEQAAHLLGVRALRDVSREQLDHSALRMPKDTYRRARHVVSENWRTERAAEALTRGDLPAFGKLMLESHRSLRVDFEVSRPELDAMVELAMAQKGCYGARMTGAGFGGCAVAMVERAIAPAFAHDVAAAYTRRTGLQPAVYICTASDGAALVQLPAAGV